jgi:hypothetical protein
MPGLMKKRMPGLMMNRMGFWGAWKADEERAVGGLPAGSPPSGADGGTCGQWDVVTSTRWRAKPASGPRHG